ncbi:MAG: NAD(P)H-hydrate epimerase [Planctomycetaceae bacterium]
MSTDLPRLNSLSRAEVRELDRRAIAEFGLPGVVLMENAGRGAAALLCQQSLQGQVLICCGKGNNGGDGYVIARHLDLAGVPVSVWSICPVEHLHGDARTHARVAVRSGIEVLVIDNPAPLESRLAELTPADWIVDALLGTGAQGDVRPPYDACIAAINGSRARVLAVDLPSGLDCDTGETLGACVHADLTATFVAHKTGFASAAAQPLLGSVAVVGIGAPRLLLDEFSLAASPMSTARGRTYQH